MPPTVQATESMLQQTPAPLAPAPADVIVERSYRSYVIAAAILVVAGVAAVRLWPRFFPSPPSHIVTASGRIEGREVTLAAKDIQGRVKALLVDEGQTVVAGQLVAELDAAQLDARREAIEGTLAALDAQITQASLDVAYTEKSNLASVAAAEAAVSSADAHVARANAVKANAETEHERTTKLLRIGVASQQDVDLALTALQTSAADAVAAEKDLAHAEAGLALAKASAETTGLKRQQVRALQASRASVMGQLAEATANLAERRLIAPANGTILSRPVEVGDVVGPGTPVFQMVDLTRLYVKVYIPEPDIGKLQLGAPADVSIDAFPNQTFAARISKISDEAEFTPKNVETAEERLKLVFGVELTFVAPDGRLKPGMPADCVIHWGASGLESARHGS